MSADRPNKRLVQQAVNKLLDPALDYLDSPDLDGFLQPGESLPVRRSNIKYTFIGHIVRNLDGPAPAGSECVQRPLPFAELQREGGGQGPMSTPSPREIILTPAHRKIAAQATAEPKTGVELIKGAGYPVEHGKPHSGQRQILADLVSIGMLIRVKKNQYVAPAAKPQAS